MTDFLEELRTCELHFIANEDTFDAKVFADYIATSSNITSLDLSYPFDETGQEEIICNGLRKNTSVRTLIIDCCSFKPEIFSNLCESLLETNVEKVLFFYSEFPNCDFSKLRVRSLTVSDKNIPLSQQQIKDILTNPNLKSLNFLNGYFTDDISMMIAEAILENKLNKLSLVNYNFSDVICKALKSNTSLRTLNLTGSNVNVDLLADSLRNNKNLKSLNLRRTKCTDSNFVLLMESNIEKLNVYDCKVSDLSPMKNNTILTKLKCSLTEFTTIAEVLSENTTLKVMHIELQNFELDTLKFIAKSLRRNTTLENLSFYPISKDNVEETTKLFIKWLGMNYTLKSIIGFHCKEIIGKFLSETERMKRMQKVRRLMGTKRSIQ